MPKILFLTTAHRYNDDRIFHHQAKELLRQGYKVKICSLSSYFQGELDGISIEAYDILGQSSDAKSETFRKILQNFTPDAIIASEPLAVIAAKKFARQNKCVLIYDITEWYPSTRMLKPYRFPGNIFHFLRFFMIQIYAGFLATHFIFGEKTKRFPLAQLFPFKPNILLPYFPDERYIFPAVNKLRHNAITLCYTGSFTKEKGIENFFNAAEALSSARPEVEISLLLIGSTPKNECSDYFSQLLAQHSFENITIKEPSNFEDFTKSFSEADICFDLRPDNYENNRCLPIKLFYYASAGKPVIYTDLKAIREHVDISKFGHLVNPADSSHIANLISEYIDDPKKYDEHAGNALESYKKHYNWSNINELFVNFIKKALSQR